MRLHGGDRYLRSADAQHDGSDHQLQHDAGADDTECRDDGVESAIEPEPPLGDSDQPQPFRLIPGTIRFHNRVAQCFHLAVEPRRLQVEEENSENRTPEAQEDLR